MYGLYIHIPFCVRKCWYCDFYSISADNEILDKYVDALLAEAQKYRGLYFDTLYIGGGTPSLLGPELLKKLINVLRGTLNLNNLTEATIEANPDSANPEFMKSAILSGINRISIGVQSLNDEELQKAGRIHNAEQSIKAIENAQKYGFTNISADIIVGLPGQSMFTLKQTLGKLIGMGLNHISVYCLSIEEHSSFAKNPPSGLPDNDEQASLFDLAVNILRTSGYIHYEISNFSLSGKECNHNLNYWRGGEYIGLGPSAASHLSGRRFKNLDSLEQYMKKPLTVTAEDDILEGQQKAEEETILRLRLLEEGLDLTELSAKYGTHNTAGIKRRLDEMVDNGGLLIRKEAHYRLPVGGVMTSNQVFVNILS